MAQAEPLAESADVSKWGHVQQVAALIVQRAFLRSRLQKAQSREQEVRDIAERLSQAGAEVLGSRLGSQESGPRMRRSTRPDGSDVAWASVLARTQSKGTLFKKSSRSKLARRLATVQIYRKLRSVAAPPCQASRLPEVEDATKGLDSPSDSDSPPSRTSRFSRASAEHQLTPYRPRSSHSPRRRSRTPPDALLNRADLTSMPAFHLPEGQASVDAHKTKEGLSNSKEGSLQNDAPTQSPRLSPSDSKQVLAQGTSDSQSSHLSPPLHPSTASPSPSLRFERGLPSSLQLSPFVGGTPPLPSKLVAKASEEIGQWREDVQRMREELAKTYKSICTLQAVLWESPTARRLISPAKFAQRGSPSRMVRSAKLPPSPLSKVSFATSVEAGNKSQPNAAKKSHKPDAPVGRDDQGAEFPELPTRLEVSQQETIGGAPTSTTSTDRGAELVTRPSGLSLSTDSRCPALFGNLSWPSPIESGRLPACKIEGEQMTAGLGPHEKADQEKTAPAGILSFLQGLFSPPQSRKTSPEGLSRSRIGEAMDERIEEDEDWVADDMRSGALFHSTSNMEGDTWHDALDEVLPRSIAFDDSPRKGASPSRLRNDSPSRTTLRDSPSRRALPDVRSSVASIAAVHLPPLTSSYSTTSPALSVDCSPNRTPENSPPRNRILVDRSHNESEDLVPHRRQLKTAPPTPFYEASENMSRQQDRHFRNGTKHTGARPERELLSTFYQLASRPPPPVTSEVLRKKASSRQAQNRISPRLESGQRASSTAVTRRDRVLKEGRHVKWWDTVEEEDKENGGSGKKPKERSPRYSPKHMVVTPSRSILKQGIPVGPRSLAHVRDMRLCKLQAQAAVGPKISGRAVRVKGRYI